MTNLVAMHSLPHRHPQGARVSAVYSALKTIYPLLRQFGKAKEKAKPTKAKKGKPKKGADKMWRGAR